MTHRCSADLLLRSTMTTAVLHSYWMCLNVFKHKLKFLQLYESWFWFKGKKAQSIVEEGDDSTVEVFPQLAQISLKVLKLHLWGLKKILGLRQRVDTSLFASILVKHNMFMHKNHTWMSKSIRLKRERASAVYTQHSQRDGNESLQRPVHAHLHSKHPSTKMKLEQIRSIELVQKWQLSPSEALRARHECQSLFMQVDFGTKFLTEFSSSGEPNYLH